MLAKLWVAGVIRDDAFSKFEEIMILSILLHDLRLHFLAHIAQYIALQISSQLLFALNRLEKTLEVTGSEAFEVVSLDDFDEHGWPVH